MRIMFEWQSLVDKVASVDPKKWAKMAIINTARHGALFRRTVL